MPRCIVPAAGRRRGGSGGRRRSASGGKASAAAEKVGDGEESSTPSTAPTDSTGSKSTGSSRSKSTAKRSRSKKKKQKAKPATPPPRKRRRTPSRGATPEKSAATPLQVPFPRRGRTPTPKGRGAKERSASLPPPAADAGVGAAPSRKPTPSPAKKGGRGRAVSPPAKVAAAAAAAAAAPVAQQPVVWVLDLDETLVHAVPEANWPGGKAPLTVTVPDGHGPGVAAVLHLRRRPGVVPFLRRCAELGTVVVWTAGVRDYAEPVVAWLSAAAGWAAPPMLLCRPDCTWDSRRGAYAKDLRHLASRMGRSVELLCLIDDSRTAGSLQPLQHVLVPGWEGAEDCRALEQLTPRLPRLADEYRRHAAFAAETGKERGRAGQLRKRLREREAELTELRKRLAGLEQAAKLRRVSGGRAKQDAKQRD